VILTKSKSRTTTKRPPTRWVVKPWQTTPKWRLVWNQPSKKPQLSSSKTLRMPDLDLQFTG
jgi:hypothetical protein